MGILVDLINCLCSLERGEARSKCIGLVRRKGLMQWHDGLRGAFEESLQATSRVQIGLTYFQRSTARILCQLHHQTRSETNMLMWCEARWSAVPSHACMGPRGRHKRGNGKLVCGSALAS